MHQLFCDHWNSFFAPLRGVKVKDVPSDAFRRWWMISDLLDLVDERRRQLQQSQSARRDARRAGALGERMTPLAQQCMVW
jgi:hypothetical protein